MKRIGSTALALVVLLTAACTKHEDRTTTSNTAAVGTAGRADTSVSSGDRDFIQDVVKANTAEIELARTASDKSTSPDVKQFAQMMVTDHTAAGDKLNAILDDLNARLAA